MGLFDGKTPSERNKMIAAGILGVVSLIALYMAFGRGLFGGSTTTATAKASPTPTPKPSGSTASNGNQFKVPSADDNVTSLIVPVVYNPGNTYGAPDAGRNIFAFYEPPPPPPYQTPSPTPPKPEIIPTPSPIPTPVFALNSVAPQSVYAGTKGAFKLDVFGDRFSPDARIYFNQVEMPTKFVSGQSLTTTIPENMIAAEGPKQVIIQTPDGRAFSQALSLNVAAPPKPTSLQYIGMIGRSRYNNDTAYLMETGKTVPFGARLSDIVGGRFRVIDISAAAVIVEDVNLGFKHRLAMTQASAGGSTQPGGFIPYNPAGGLPPGIPPNSRQVPQPPRPDQKRPPNSKDDVDDNDDPPK